MIYSVKTLSIGHRASLIGPSPTLSITTRAKELKASGIDVISLAAGEPDFATPAPIVEAAIKALHDGQTKYAPTKGIPSLQEAIVKKVARDNGFTCKPNQIIVSTGAKQSLFNSLQVLIDPGDEVILIAPYWMTYKDQILLAGGTPAVVHTDSSSSFLPTLEQIQEKVTNKTKAIIVNSPSNPTGAAWPRQLVKDVAALALKYGLWIISDEIYEHLIYGHTHTSFASLSQEVAERTVTILGCSKTYSMTGWRIGFSVSTPELASAMGNIQDQVTSGATTFAQFGAAEALDMGTDIIEEMRQIFEERRNFGMEILSEISDVRIKEPLGAFYFFVDVSQYLGGKIQTDLELAKHLLDEANIATVPGSVFEGDGHLRLSYAASQNSIELGLRRLEKALLELKA